MLLNFDYDGVIVDSLDHLLNVTVKAQDLIGVGRKPTKQDFVTLEEMSYEELAKVIEIPDHHYSEFMETVRDLERQPQAPSVLFPRITNMFKGLAQRHKIVIITASTTETVIQTLEENNLNGTVAEIMGGELGLSKAKRIAISQSRFDQGPDDTAMIGDAISDIRQGKLARVKTVAVTWGFQSRALLAAESPDFIVETPEELLTVLGKDEPW